MVIGGKGLLLNILEMKAVQLALNAFKYQWESHALMRDTATVVAYFKKQGGTASLSLCKLGSGGNRMDGSSDGTHHREVHSRKGKHSCRPAESS